MEENTILIVGRNLAVKKKTEEGTLLLYGVIPRPNLFGSPSANQAERLKDNC